MLAVTQAEVNIMRVKLSGPVEMVEALEAALQSTPNAVLETPLMRRENAELRFGVTEIADIIGIVKVTLPSWSPYAGLAYKSCVAYRPGVARCRSQRSWRSPRLELMSG
jgi:hypothetical protein